MCPLRKVCTPRSRAVPQHFQADMRSHWRSRQGKHGRRHKRCTQIAQQPVDASHEDKAAQSQHPPRNTCPVSTSEAGSLPARSTRFRVDKGRCTGTLPGLMDRRHHRMHPWSTQMGTLHKKSHRRAPSVRADLEAVAACSRRTVVPPPRIPGLCGRS
eukprot:2557209-Prymnesium_polylepis.3